MMRSSMRVGGTRVLCAILVVGVASAGWGKNPTNAGKFARFKANGAVGNSGQGTIKLKSFDSGNGQVGKQSFVGVRNKSLGKVQFLSNPGNAVSLNPQPLPPKVLGTNSLQLGDTVSLNPQPLPPKAKFLSNGVRLGDAVSLNPQPLPPKEVQGARFTVVK